MDKLLKAYVDSTDENGMDLTPYIRTYQVEYTDIEAFNERTASGRCVRDISRTIKTVKCSFKSMPKGEAMEILSILNSGELEIAYYDTAGGIYSETGRMKVYPSVSRNTSVYSVNPETVYNEISVEFTEI